MKLTNAHEIRNAVNSGEVSAREVAQAALKCIEALDGKLIAEPIAQPQRARLLVTGAAVPAF